MDIAAVMLGVVLIVAVLLLMTWLIRNYQEEKLEELPDEKWEEIDLRRRHPGLARMERYEVLRWVALISLMGLALFLLAILIRWMWIHHDL